PARRTAHPGTRLRARLPARPAPAGHPLRPPPPRNHDHGTTPGVLPSTLGLRLPAPPTPAVAPGAPLGRGVLRGAGARSRLHALAGENASMHRRDRVARA